MDESRKTGLIPDGMNLVITNDMSDVIRKQVNNLENSIIMGMIFVITVLFFFLGYRNALFVGLAIPMSMLISFIILGFLGYVINMMILFGLVLALGMLVDNAIVVVENVHRFIERGYTVKEATRQAVGEIAWPIIASTATTLAAFFPLIFWPGMVGSFMGLLPITLIVVLTASLFVALVIIPTFVVLFIKPGKEEKAPRRKSIIITLIVMSVIIALGYITGVNWLANFTLFMAVLVAANYLFLHNWSVKFQGSVLDLLESMYLKILHWALSGTKPRWLLGGGFLLLIATTGFYFGMGTNVLFFPNTEPRFLNVTMELPIGTHIDSTNQFAYQIDKKINEIIEKDSSIIKSVLTTVGKGAVGERQQVFGNTPEKAITTITFIDYDLRRDHRPSQEILKELSDSLIGEYPGVQISVEKSAFGPPTGKPINIEVVGRDYTHLVKITDSIMAFLENTNIPGIEGLKRDVDPGKPELIINVDRDKARRFGLSTGQIGSSYSYRFVW